MYSYDHRGRDSDLNGQQEEFYTIATARDRLDFFTWVVCVRRYAYKLLRGAKVGPQMLLLAPPDDIIGQLAIRNAMSFDRARLAW